MASALAPLAEAGTVLNAPLRADQLPPKTVHRLVQSESKFSLKEFTAVRTPSQGNQLKRKCCEPNGTSVTAWSGLVDAVGLGGGSKACVPRQPFVQAGRGRAFARRRTDGCAGSNGFGGVVK